MTEPVTEATPEEWEEFNRVERESKAKQESIRGIKHPTREQLMAELDVAQMLIRELGDRLSRLEKTEQDSTYVYASSLATEIWQKHYMKESPKFALLDTTEGVLTQIDNMTCGLVREKPAQPEQEPVGKLQEPTAERAWFTIAELNAWADKKLSENPHWVMPKDEPERDEAPPQRTWVGLTDEEIADCAEKMEASDPTDSFWREFFRGIEAKLKEKNT